ncbi:MAG TPA: TetR/AcrR family transcriptional regulator [Desulfobacteraceae bacterium]|nr:TetR/AcrR family transcriptional regulator [Deltaproteobacteria bacterium]RLB97291.1 MAG: TetR/AcrR family transcriptional regulator [Deltaproteobacteria bacterium]HDI59208.1 TetR/AcrR family transcriptional regulator [Desulfobacteraceae bacterium]
MKGRILEAARRLFGEYGFSGVTTRMLAKEVGIDISTLYYHWGEKQDLYEAVMADLSCEIRGKLREIERMVRGAALSHRLEVAIEVMCDWLFEHPEAAKLMLSSYMGKSRSAPDTHVPIKEHIANIAVAMGLALDTAHVPARANARVLTVWNSVINFTAGEDFFRPLLGVNRNEYRSVVKETLKFILIPAFARSSAA